MAALKQGVPITLNQSSLATGSNRLKSDLEFTGLYQNDSLSGTLQKKSTFEKL